LDAGASQDPAPHPQAGADDPDPGLDQVGARDPIRLVKRPLEGPLLVDQVHPTALQDLLEAQTDMLGQFASAGVEVRELVVEFVEEVYAVLDQFDPGSVVERVDRGIGRGTTGRT
jgi:hypothetical protein